MDEVEEYIHVIEWDSDYDTKHDLLEILLEGLYNPSLTERVESFISKYIPAPSVYHDVRLSGLVQVDGLTDDERRFVVHTLINGDVSNKILASDVIRKHIVGDEILLDMVNAYISSSTMPEVVAFFIRSVIADGIDISKEEFLIAKVFWGDLYTRFYRIEFSLFKGEAVSVEEILKLASELPFTIKDEATRLMTQYFAQNVLVRQQAIKSVNSKVRVRDAMGKDFVVLLVESSRCYQSHRRRIKTGISF